MGRRLFCRLRCVVATVCSRSMRIVRVPLGGRSYSIKIGSGILSTLGVECRRLALGKRCAVITDRRVARHWAGAAIESLKGAGFEPFLVTVPGGETSKSLSVVERC